MNVLEERWYAVEPPFGDGTWIRARAVDALGAFVCDCNSLVPWAEGDATTTPQDIAAYIVALHNDALDRSAVDARVIMDDAREMAYRQGHQDAVRQITNVIRAGLGITADVDVVSYLTHVQQFVAAAGRCLGAHNGSPEMHERLCALSNASRALRGQHPHRKVVCAHKPEPPLPYDQHSNAAFGF